MTAILNLLTDISLSSDRCEARETIVMPFGPQLLRKLKAKEMPAKILLQKP
jgi:hypothetical protein